LLLTPIQKDYRKKVAESKNLQREIQSGKTKNALETNLNYEDIRAAVRLLLIIILSISAAVRSLLIITFSLSVAVGLLLIITISLSVAVGLLFIITISLWMMVST
jgi:hypothetical protein